MDNDFRFKIEGETNTKKYTQFIPIIANRYTANTEKDKLMKFTIIQSEHECKIEINLSTLYITKINEDSIIEIEYLPSFLNKKFNELTQASISAAMYKLLKGELNNYAHRSDQNLIYVILAEAVRFKFIFNAISSNQSFSYPQNNVSSVVNEWGNFNVFIKNNGKKKINITRTAFTKYLNRDQ